MAKEIGQSTKTGFLTLMSIFDYDNGVGEAKNPKKRNYRRKLTYFQIFEI